MDNLSRQSKSDSLSKTLPQTRHLSSRLWELGILISSDMWLNWDIFKLEVKMQVLKNKLENLPASKCKQWNYANWACVDTPVSIYLALNLSFRGLKCRGEGGLLKTPRERDDSGKGRRILTQRRIVSVILVLRTPRLQIFSENLGITKISLHHDNLEMFLLNIFCVFWFLWFFVFV